MSILAGLDATASGQNTQRRARAYLFVPFLPPFRPSVRIACLQKRLQDLIKVVGIAKKKTQGSARAGHDNAQAERKRRDFNEGWPPDPLVFALRAPMVYIPKSRYDQAYQSIVSSARKAISTSGPSSSSAATVLVLVSADPDGLCACKIFTTLLRDDCIGHRVLPVSGWAELARIHQEQVADNPDLRSVVLLNLGSLLDLVDSFPLPAEATLHVVDSHRPWNLANVFASGPEAEQIIVWDDGDIDQDLIEERKAFEAVQVRSTFYLACLGSLALSTDASFGLPFAVRARKRF